MWWPTKMSWLMTFDVNLHKKKPKQFVLETVAYAYMYSNMLLSQKIHQKNVDF